eukprot:NODE_113_length_19319_cov_0.247815.p6 type:complete len:387 gc:universal NODE_113_length_19319_cov_0.247815:7821-8981(+)
MNFGAIVWAAIQPILTVLIMVIIGVILTKKRIYHQEVMKSLGKFALQFLAPCLMMTKTAASISPSNIMQYLFIMLITSIYQVYYIIAAFIIFFLTKRYCSPTFRTSVMSSTAFGNWGDFPIAILIAIGNSPPFEPGDSDKGIAFVTAILLLYYPLIFSLGVHWIESDYKSIKVEYLDNKTEEESNVVAKPEPKFYHKEWFRLIVFNPNIIGIVIGLMLGLIAPLNKVFVSSDGALFFVFNTLKTMGNAYIPIGLTLFGANLIYADFSIFKRMLRIPVTHNDTELPKKIYVPIFAVIFTRLVISPIIGIAFVNFLISASFIDPMNKILQFVLILPMCMPMAQMNLVLSQIYHPKGKPEEMATMVAICYFLTPFSLIVSLSVAIYTLS